VRRFFGLADIADIRRGLAYVLAFVALRLTFAIVLY
jgi:hypothetical protein